MKYYFLRPNINTKEIGEYPQSQDVKVMGDIQRDELQQKGSIDFEFEMPEPVLVPKAALTTYLSVVAIPSRFLVLEDNFLLFLQNFPEIEFQSWKLLVHHRKKMLKKYNLFYIPDSSENILVDFKKSSFSLVKNSKWRDKGEPVYVDNYEDYLRKKAMLENEVFWLKPTHLFLDFSNIQTNFIRISNIFYGSGYYISEKLKAAIEKVNFTGMAFREIESKSSKIEVKF